MATLTVVLIITSLSLVYGQNTSSCTSASECPSYECCQLVKSWPQAVGRRASQGECRPIRTQGQSCWVHPGTDGVRPTGVVTECPCEVPLHCVGIGAYVQPFGEAGNCGF